MPQVRIVILLSDNPRVVVSGEVKAVDVTALPTIAHVEATTAAANADSFVAAPGRHTFQFSIRPSCRVTLSTMVDGRPVGPPEEFDATGTNVNAGLHYTFEVRS